MEGERRPDVAVTPSAGESRASRLRALGVVALLVAVTAAAGLWAGRATVGGASQPQSVGSGELRVAVTEQTLGRVLNLNVTVQQPKTALAVNMLPGVVVSARANVRAEQGSTLYVVAGTPVRAVQGSVPFYRDLRIGMLGRDVRQLRSALVTLGYLSTAGDMFDTSTYWAVRAWQRHLGIAESGWLKQGELVAVPNLPSRLVVDPQIASAGQMLSGGETVVYGARGAPRFSLVVSEDQARLIPETAAVTMTFGGHRWQARIAQASASETGETQFELVALNGGRVCGNDCEIIPTGAATSILSQVAVVPPATGPAVPVAAIVTAADGNTFVRVQSDSGLVDRAVSVVASQDGVAVVDGVNVGDRVQVFAASSNIGPGAATTGASTS